MYAKVFAQMYEGSMLGAGLGVFAVWPYMLARCDEKGRVEVNPRLAAAQIGCSIGDVQDALNYLAAPDPQSRTDKFDGRRIERQGEFLYLVLNYTSYLKVRNREERAEYQREWDRANRPTRPDRTRQNPTNPTQRDGDGDVDGEREGVLREEISHEISCGTTAHAAAPPDDSGSSDFVWGQGNPLPMNFASYAPLTPEHLSAIPTQCPFPSSPLATPPDAILSPSDPSTLPPSKKSPRRGPQRDLNVLRGEPADPEAEALFVFPTSGAVPTVTVYSDWLRPFRAAYPATDVIMQTQKALAWVLANPAQRKTASGMGRFLNGWFSRAQNRGGG